MKKPPSAFSYVKRLLPGESASVPKDMEYATRCAVSYMEAEYGYTYSILSQDGTVIVTRTI